MGKRLVLAGYFGRGNLGDDAILLGFNNAAKDLGYGYVTICGSPEGLMRSYGLQGVGHLDFKAIQAAIESADALVFPGGSVFQDVTSVRSVAYYANLVKAAKKADKKVVMLGQGIGPINRFLGRRLAVGALASADAIAVRDPESANELRRLGVPGTPRVTADAAFLLPEPPHTKDQSQFGVGGMKSVGVSARPAGKDKSKHVIKTFGQLLRLLFDHGWVPAMIEMDREIDRPIIDKIGKEHGGKVPEIKGLTSPIELQKRLMRMDAVIGMRLHAGVLAATVGVPAYMVSYDPKINAFTNAMGLPNPQSIEGTTAERIFDGFQAHMKDRDRVVANIKRRRDELAKKAQENIEVLLSTVGS